MLYKRIFLIVLVRHVMTVNCSSNITEEAIVESFMVEPFLDDNNYIRLNLSWTRVIDKPHMISVRFKNNEDCNPINDVENYFITDNQYLIIPDMKMKYPADTLVHGCDYEISLENEELEEALQQIQYTVPECVGDRCACGDIRDSPYQLETITPVHKYYFLVTWKVLTTDNLTVHEVYYQRDIFDTKTFIPSKNIVYHKNGIQIPLPDLKSGVRYHLFVYFDDRYNECLYYSSIYLKVPDSRRTLFTVIIVIIVILGLIIVVYVGAKSSRKLRAKLNDSFTNLQTLILCYRSEDQQLSAPLSPLNIRMENNILYTPLELDLVPHDTYEIPVTEVIIKEEIGEGAFGKVYRGGIYLQERSGEQIQVAIKMLREGAPEGEFIDFQNEIETLKKVGEHENIVKLLACVTVQAPLMIIMELIPGGSLKNYLLNLRGRWKRRKDGVFSFPDTSYSSYIVPICNRKAADSDDVDRVRNASESISLPPRSPMSLSSSKQLSSSETVTSEVDLSMTPLIKDPLIDSKELQDFALQIARGMAYLEGKGITHRDLAARNILITSEVKKTLKISDFGMSRKGTYVSSKGRKLPLRWMAIEAIEERTCDSKSDVWSFGILLWEIGTLGAFPYEKTVDNMVLHNLKMGKRLERPEICTDHLYSLMLKCWSEKPVDRPSFFELQELLDNERRKVYIEFSALNPEYMFPPTHPHCTN